MCDYSLMGIPSRLAREGEELIVYTFQTGSKGMTSSAGAVPSNKNLFWAAWGELKDMFRSPGPRSVTAVCIPPGAQLVLRDIPSDIQRSMSVSEIENVTFTQLGMPENRHRDAVRFINGSEILLQHLSNGQRVTVVSLDSDAANGEDLDEVPSVAQF